MRPQVHRRVAVRFHPEAEPLEEASRQGRGDQGHQPAVMASLEGTLDEGRRDASAAPFGIHDDVPDRGVQPAVVEEAGDADQGAVRRRGRESCRPMRGLVDAPGLALRPVCPGVGRVHLLRAEHRAGGEAQLRPAPRGHRCRAPLSGLREERSRARSRPCKSAAADRSWCPLSRSSPSTARSSPAGGLSRSSW